MRRFLASGWFPIVTAIVLAAATTGAYAWMKPLGADIGNSEIQQYATWGGWAIGSVAALLSLIVAGILNLVRRIVRVRRVNLLHPVVGLIAFGPWLIFSWVIAGEPRYTPAARAIIDFGARPLILGSFAAVLFIVLFSLPLLFPKRT